MADEKIETKEEVIKVGDNEFSQEELNEIIGAGQKLREIETKQGQPVEDILKSWGRRGEDIGNYKKQLEEKEKELQELKTPKSTEVVSEEQEKEAVISEARKYGLLTKDEAIDMMDKIYSEKRNSEKILSDVEKVVRKSKRDGKPEVTTEDLLQFMADPSNPKDAQNAYDIMFKNELKEWEKSQLETIKNKGMVTETRVQTSKSPEPKTISTRDGLKEALSEHFSNYRNE